MSDNPQPSPVPPQRTIKRSARKLDRTQVERMAKLGLNANEIAKHQGVDRSTVWRFLKQHRLNLLQVETFKAQRADIFAGLSAEAISLQKRILETFDDGIVGALKPGEKTGLLMALNAIGGTIYDKERLERGQSTENHSFMHKLLGVAFDSVHKPLINKASNESVKSGS